jgi:ABC-type Co2+ transport system permease subunit
VADFVSDFIAMWQVCAGRLAASIRLRQTRRATSQTIAGAQARSKYQCEAAWFVSMLKRYVPAVTVSGLRWSGNSMVAVVLGGTTTFITIFPFCFVQALDALP